MPAPSPGLEPAPSAGKLERCRELGADLAIDYRSQDFVAEVRNAFGGADVVLDNMGAAYLSRNIDVLAPDGRLVVIGMQGGTKGEMNFGKLLAKRGHVIATGLRGRPDTGKSGKSAIVAAVREHLWPLIEEAKVQPVVHAELPITEAARAHEMLDLAELPLVEIRGGVAPVDDGDHPGAEDLRVAVMGCVVNGPGESKHADIGISLPGTFEEPVAPVFIDGRLDRTLRGEGLVQEFIDILEDYVARRFPTPGAVSSATQP
mgnify:CR=1 FL=1